MKRKSYVDEAGNVIDQSFESKKTFLRLFFIIGTIIPLIIIGFIIYTMVDNKSCQKVYKAIKTATLEYIKDKGIVPTYEGESVTININKLYSSKLLTSYSTKDLISTGKVKVTKYKDEYIYTLDIHNCSTCSTNKRYGTYSEEVSYYQPNKTIVDVIPYYNYYERQISTTDWSKEYIDEEIDTKTSKYGVKLPKEEEMEHMPKVPTEGEVFEVQTEESLEYRYRDKQWLWYDSPKDYSEFSSEMPEGYTNKDTSTKQYTKWSEYSLDHPEEKEYREIQSTIGYKFYYEKDGKKIYANNGKYTATEDIDRTKYNRYEEDTSPLYRYRDAKWRWYNGEKRRYSSYRSDQTTNYPYRDDETLKYNNYSTWYKKTNINQNNISYREEETRVNTKYRYVYEIISLPILDKAINRENFIKKTDMTPPEFATKEDYKLEVTYKFKYRKR